jgi:NtrC-family two-component system sensor histidine kinase KinB
MDNVQKLQRSLRRYLFAIVTIDNVLAITVDWWLTTHTELNHFVAALLSLLLGLLLSVWMVWLASRFILQPIRALWQAILHLSPTEHGVAAPQLDSINFGKELVMSLVNQLYQITDITNRQLSEKLQEGADLSHNFIAENLPLPLFVLDPTEMITFANQAAATYIGIPAKDMIGKNVYMVLDMSFPSDDTFDKWLKSAKTSSATAVNTWERVRLNVRDNHPARLFDLAAYYNRENPQHVETMVTLFDHTKQYSQDDQAVSFIALSVHELRTPLTLLRGYIEVFEEEFSDKMDDELKGFMLKMRSQAEQLMAFVNNILNVARVDDDQLELQLEEGDWPAILKSAIEALSLRAKVRGITLHCRLATDLPTVGVDRLSIYEVINNLIDNAIKYSGTSTTIEVDAHLTQEGLVETTVKDYGLGISTSIMPNLFTKFYRDHRNRAQIGGTGLGLYLSKAIITAHGGSLWVRSKPGEGSTFGFTLLPYSQLTDELKRSGNQEIVRSAHGWIKNHSLYRR